MWERFQTKHLHVSDLLMQANIKHVVVCCWCCSYAALETFNDVIPGLVLRPQKQLIRTRAADLGKRV